MAKPKQSPNPGAAAQVGPPPIAAPPPSKPKVAAVPSAQKKAIGNAAKHQPPPNPPKQPSASPPPAAAPPIAGGNPAPVRRRRGRTPPPPYGTPAPTRHTVITHVASGPYQAPFHERIAGSKEVRAVPTSVVFVVGMGLVITNSITTGMANRLWELIYDGKKFVRQPSDPPLRVLLGEILFVAVAAFLSQINDELGVLILVFFFGLWVLWIIQNGDSMRRWIILFTGKAGEPTSPTPVAPPPLPGQPGYTFPIVDTPGGFGRA